MVDSGNAVVSLLSALTFSFFFHFKINIWFCSFHNEMVHNDTEHCTTPTGPHIVCGAEQHKDFFCVTAGSPFPRCLELESRANCSVSHTFFVGSQHLHETQTPACGWHLLQLLGGNELVLKVRRKVVFLRHDATDRGTYHRAPRTHTGRGVEGGTNRESIVLKLHRNYKMNIKR